MLTEVKKRNCVSLTRVLQKLFFKRQHRWIDKKEDTAMNCHANKCIECTVKSCAYHCDTENYCSLDKIMVGTHEANPAMDQCTDCKSFRKK